MSIAQTYPCAGLFIISGTSGSGKTIALQSLEDIGFHCIDNLPASLLPEIAQRLHSNNQPLAISIDSRNLDAIDTIQPYFSTLETLSINYSVLFLDAKNKTLLKRYSETRRKHPLSNKSTSLSEAIHKERRHLQFISEIAQHTISTSETTLHELRAMVKNIAFSNRNKKLILLLQSFGFKYGTPTDMDYLFDVRCLPNPYWEPPLRPLTGLDTPIQIYLEKQELCATMLEHVHEFITFWMQKFVQQDRNYLTLAIGCTGGKHRSVFLVEKLYQKFNALPDIETQIRHRELNI